MNKLFQQLGWVLSVLLISGFAQARELPVYSCSGNECGEEQRAMFDRFTERGVGIQGIQPEAVYSGVCHWNGIYNPKDVHYAGFFWYQSPATGELAFKGRLTYFASPNPYSDYTPEMAREKWFSNPTDYIPEFYDDYAFMNLNPDAPVIHQILYWFRADMEDPSRLYMVVLHGLDTMGVCELDQNQAAELQ